MAAYSSTVLESIVSGWRSTSSRLSLRAVLGLLKSFIGKPAVFLVGGDVAGPLTITGIAVGDEILAVLSHVGDGSVLDLTAEFTITATDTINNVGGTDTTGHRLAVHYLDLT